MKAFRGITQRTVLIMDLQSGLLIVMVATISLSMFYFPSLRVPSFPLYTHDIQIQIPTFPEL
jgi:hypothetical protein